MGSHLVIDNCLMAVFAWTLCPWNEPIASWYATINLGIHSCMYLYFALRGLRVRVPNVFAMLITSTQTLQMVVCYLRRMDTQFICKFLLSLLICRYFLSPATGVHCSRYPNSIKFSVLIFVSLWLLFVKFFWDRYFGKSKLKAKGD